MATAVREDQQPYVGGGGGAGGKFRKRPFRRNVLATPYDRPPPATLPFPNPNGDAGGWLSKLVDPAQRLISAGAHRLFSSVFRKRLTQPEPPLSLPVTNLEGRSKQPDAVAMDFVGVPNKSVDQGDGPSYSASGELTALEQVLKEKTFTRSEIDRLTALLHSRTVDLAIEDKGKRSEVVPFKQTVSLDREEGFPQTPILGTRWESEAFPKTPAPESRIENLLVSSPAVHSTVREGGVASPTEVVELAKSYMHKKPMSPSMLGFRNQATVENSTATHTLNLSSPSRLPFTPIVPRITSGHVEARENGFYTPRPRGRSAIYTMARTPYSRVHLTNNSKDVEKAVDIYGSASSSSQYTQGALKRRNSVLESDIGSFGAIRRIRQKPNLLSSRGLSVPVSSTPLPSSRTSLGFGAAQNAQSSRLKPLSSGEPLRSAINPSVEDGDSCMPNANVPSKSSEMASKILQQLDKLVSPKDKLSEPKALALMDTSPKKLSPSMLRGQALKSLEHIDSSKFLGDIQHNKMVDGSHNKMVGNAQASTSQEQGKVKENGPLKLGSAHYKFTSKVNGSAMPIENGEGSTLSKKGDFLGTSTPTFNSVAQPPQKKRAFQMSAFEDFVDLDEDVIPNGSVTDSLPEEKRKVSFSLVENKSSATELVKLDKGSVSTEIKPAASESKWKTDIGTSTGSITAEKSSNLVIQNASSPSATVFPKIVNNDSLVSPPAFNIGAVVASEKDANAASPTVNLGLLSAEESPGSQVSFVAPSPFRLFPSSDRQLETPSNLSTVADGAPSSLPKLPEPDRADKKDIEAVPSSVSSSNANMFFNSTATPNSVSLMNGPSVSTSSTPLVFNTFSNQNSSGSANNVSPFTFASTSSLTTSNSAPSLPATSIFKFGSSVPTTTEAPDSKTTPSSIAPVLAFAPSAVPNTASEAIKKEASFSDLSTPPAATASTASSLFGFTTNASSTSANQSSSQSSLARTFSQNIPVQLGSTSSSSTFGLAGSTAGSTGSAIASSTFGLKIDAKPFSQVTSLGLGNSSSSSSSEANVGSSSSTSAPSVIGSTWQQPKSPVFGFNASPSTGFSFTASSTSSAATNSSPSTGFTFGATSAPSSSGVSFGASSAASVSANSSVSAGFAFSSTPSATTNSSSPFTFAANSPSVMNGVTTFGNGSASTGSPFQFNSTSTAQPVFANLNPGFGFSGTTATTTPLSNDQMNMEDSMAEDTVQSSAAATPGASLFGQPQPISQSPPAFTFGSAVPAPAPSVGNMFQFGSNPSPFQASGSLGSNFSMGSGSGADKSNRRFIKVKTKKKK